MGRNFDDERFLALRRKSENALQLSARAREVLASRDVRSFDGFGHFLDAILPDDPTELEHIAAVLRLSMVHLQRMRLSKLDPLSLPPEEVVFLGQVVGMGQDQFEKLILRDHERFVPFARGVTARGDNASDDSELATFRAAWATVAEDSASEL